MVEEEELHEASPVFWQDKLDQEEEEEDLDVEEEVQETEEDSVVEVSFYLNRLASFHLFVFRWIWWRQRRKIRALPGILYLCLNFCNFFYTT